MLCDPRRGCSPPGLCEMAANRVEACDSRACVCQRVCKTSAVSQLNTGTQRISFFSFEVSSNALQRASEPMRWGAEEVGGAPQRKNR